MFRISNTRGNKLPDFGPFPVCSDRLLHNLPQACCTQTSSEKNKHDLELSGYCQKKKIIKDDVSTPDILPI